MPFRFTLAPLLRLRQSLEHQHELKLQDANAKVMRTETTLSDLDNYVLAALRRDNDGLKSGCTAAELQFAVHLLDNLLRFRQELELEIHKLKLQRQQTLAEYHAIRRGRELLENLRTIEHRAYQQQQLRRDQQQADANFLLQRWHRQKRQTGK